MVTTTKTKLVNRVAAATQMKRGSILSSVDYFLKELSKEIVIGNRVAIRGLGTFWPSITPARMYRNPKTGAAVPGSAKRRVHFRASTLIKRDICQTMVK